MIEISENRGPENRGEDRGQCALSGDGADFLGLLILAVTGPARRDSCASKRVSGTIRSLFGR